MLPILASLSLANTTIGNCHFNGERPDHVITTNGMILHYEEDLEMTGVVGKFNVWEGTGNVWVVFTDSESYRKNAFIVKGNLQTCYGGK